MVLEPGLELHDWETRWQQLCELAVDSPDEALQELAEAAETTEVEPEDVRTALDNLIEIHDYLVEDRRPV